MDIQKLSSTAMASSCPWPGRLRQQHLRDGRHLVMVTCLHWDRDGALHEEDRQSMLQKLAAHEAAGVALPGNDWLAVVRQKSWNHSRVIRE